jgi:hypothetical protein
VKHTNIKEYSRTREGILNKAIHELIQIKKRRINDGDTLKRIQAAQKAIDKMMNMKYRMTTAQRYLMWREKSAK